MGMIGGERFKKLSKLEKIGVVSSLAMGVDAIIAPALPGGKTLHQTIAEGIGMPIPQAIEYGIKLAEGGLACLGLLYYAGRNVHLACKETEKPTS